MTTCLIPIGMRLDWQGGKLATGASEAWTVSLILLADRCSEPEAAGLVRLLGVRLTRSP